MSAIGNESNEKYEMVSMKLGIYGINPPWWLHRVKVDRSSAETIPALSLLLISLMIAGFCSYSNNEGSHLKLLASSLIIVTAALSYFISRGIKNYSKKDDKLKAAVRAWLSHEVSSEDLASVLRTKLSGPCAYAVIDKIFQDGDEVTYQKLLEKYEAMSEAIQEDYSKEADPVMDYSDDIKSILEINRA